MPRPVSGSSSSPSPTIQRNPITIVLPNWAELAGKAIHELHLDTAGQPYLKAAMRLFIFVMAQTFVKRWSMTLNMAAGLANGALGAIAGLLGREIFEANRTEYFNAAKENLVHFLADVAFAFWIVPFVIAIGYTVAPNYTSTALSGITGEFVRYLNAPSLPEAQKA